MSGKISGGVWDLDLPQNKMLVLLAMADHADHEGNKVFPSMGLIAWKTGYSVRQVQRIVHELENDKILVLKSAPEGDVKTYSINLSAGKNKPPRLKENTPDTNVTPDIVVSPPPLTQSCHPTPDIVVSPKPSGKRQGKRQSGSVKPRDLLFDCLSVNLFEIPLEQKLTKDEGTCIGLVTSDLRKKYSHIAESDLIDRLLRWIEHWKETHPPDINLPLASAKVLKHFGAWYDDMGFDLTWKPYIPVKPKRQEDYPS